MVFASAAECQCVPVRSRDAMATLAEIGNHIKRTLDIVCFCINGLMSLHVYVLNFNIHKIWCTANGLFAAHNTQLKVNECEL